jgi:putative flippase GtrA
MPSWNELVRKFSAKETMKFIVGGSSAVLTDFATYYLLLYLGVYVAYAKCVSYVLGAIVGFVINKIWTFESKKFKFEEVWKYVVLYLVSALANTLVNQFILYIVSVKIIAFLVATGFSTIVNFLGQKFIVFKKDEE